MRGAANGREMGAAPSTACDEAALIGKIARKDLRAFEALYRVYHPRLSRFLHNLVRRQHLVEEALNDAMLVVWRRADSFNGASKVSTWIFSIAYRKGLQALRRHDEPVEDAYADLRESGEAGPEQRLGQSQVNELLRLAMAELSADHRAVIDLTYFHEIGYREIAEIMDCPVDTVKTRMFHARRHLKAKLAGRLSDWL
ncbi:MAG: sigma-70 family RNA polymerase sigma factor [Caulobacteraceae bacterium]|nr:sigma-70 family RNA polymerase sigma factor [Caulobacteraceae bacterium]